MEIVFKQQQISGEIFRVDQAWCKWHRDVTSGHAGDDGGDPRRWCSPQALRAHLGLAVESLLQFGLLRLQLVDVSLQCVHGLLKLPV